MKHGKTQSIHTVQNINTEKSHGRVAESEIEPVTSRSVLNNVVTEKNSIPWNKAPKRVTS